MKTIYEKLILATLCFLIFVEALGEDPSSVKPRVNISVNLEDVSSNDGQFIILIFSKDKGFPGNIAKADEVVKFKASDVVLLNKVSVQIKVPHQVAISVIHDKDLDGKLDSNFVGIPREPVGVSNNIEGSFGPPPFAKAKRIFEEGDSVAIKMRQP